MVMPGGTTPISEHDFGMLNLNPNLARKRLAQRETLDGVSKIREKAVASDAVLNHAAPTSRFKTFA